MAAVRSKDTKIELDVRTFLHAKGFRYRLHVTSLPGVPDLVLPKYRAVVFVNGCFWHGHNCELFKWPKNSAEFWKDKITKTKQRDARSITTLEELGWKVATIWECALRSRSEAPMALVELQYWLKSGVNSTEIRK